MIKWHLDIAQRKAENEKVVYHHQTNYVFKNTRTGIKKNPKSAGMDSKETYGSQNEVKGSQKSQNGQQINQISIPEKKYKKRNPASILN